MSGLSRRQFLRWGLPAGLGLAGTAVAASGTKAAAPMPPGMAHPNPTEYVGTRPAPVALQAPGALDPMQILTAIDSAKVTSPAHGGVQRD